MEEIRKVTFCPHCGNRAPQRHIYTQEYLDQGYYMDGTLAEFDYPCTYYVAVCETCNQILLYRAGMDDMVDDKVNDKCFHLAELIWPDSGVLHKSVPKTITECYSEAVRIKFLAPNAFAVQIRRALETLCNDREAKKGNLQSRLKDLASRGEIPPTLAEMTDVLRLLGNIGAHATDQSVKPGHVSAINDFFRAIIEYVYVAPSKLKEFKNGLENLETKKATSDNT